MQAAKYIVNPSVYNEVAVELVTIKPIVQSSRYLDPVRIEVPARTFVLCIILSIQDWSRLYHHLTIR